MSKLSPQQTPSTKTAVLLSMLSLANGVLGSLNQFVPMKCGSSTTDVTNCQFDGDYCSYENKFDEPVRATYWDQYNGDPNSADFIIESGTPSVAEGHLKLPLLENPGNRQSFATIMATTRFLNFGSFEARLKTVYQPSVVTTLISMSNVEDEIDFEFVPKDPSQFKQVQANWYSKGQAQYDLNFMDYNATHNTFDEFHTYRVDWTPDYVQWSVDGVAFNKLEKAKMGANATKFPATPARIQFGVWQALDNDWAGRGDVDWSKNPDLTVRFDYLKVIGMSCGGGELTAAPAISKGFLPENRPIFVPVPGTPGTIAANGSATHKAASMLLGLLVFMLIFV